MQPLHRKRPHRLQRNIRRKTLPNLKLGTIAICPPRATRWPAVNITEVGVLSGPVAQGSHFHGPVPAHPACAGVVVHIDACTFHRAGTVLAFVCVDDEGGCAWDGQGCEGDGEDRGVHFVRGWYMNYRLIRMCYRINGDTLDKIEKMVFDEKPGYWSWVSHCFIFSSLARLAFQCSI